MDQIIKPMVKHNLKKLNRQTSLYFFVKMYIGYIYILCIVFAKKIN